MPFDSVAGLCYHRTVMEGHVDGDLLGLPASRIGIPLPRTRDSPEPVTTDRPR